MTKPKSVNAMLANKFENQCKSQLHGDVFFAPRKQGTGTLRGS